MGDGNLHRHFDLPCVLAGNLGGRFKTGYHHAYADKTPMCNLLLTILESLEELETRLRELEARSNQPSHVQAGEKTVGGAARKKA